MKKSILSAVLFALSATPMLFAAQAIVLDQKNIKADYSKEVSYPGANKIVVSKQCMLTMKDLVPVEKGKKYGFKGVYKSLNGFNIFLGFKVFDANKKEFGCVNYKEIPLKQGTTFTTFVKDVQKTDKAVIVKDASQWKVNTIFRAVYNAKADKSDIPNRNVVNAVIKKIEKTGADWTITFDKPVGIAAKAGTGVREHTLGGYVYLVINNKEIAEPKQRYAAESFPQGTAFIQPLLLINWNAPKTAPAAVTEIVNAAFVIE